MLITKLLFQLQCADEFVPLFPRVPIFNHIARLSIYVIP